MTKSFKTFLKHTAKDYHNQSVNPPVVRASTIIFKSMQDIRKTQNKAKNDAFRKIVNTKRSHITHTDIASLATCQYTTRKK